MSEGLDGGDRFMTPEEVACAEERRERSRAAYRAKLGDAPLSLGDIGGAKWRTPVDFRVVDHVHDPDRRPQRLPSQRPSARRDELLAQLADWDARVQQ